MTHKQGWKFCFVAGLLPFAIGLYGYITAFVMSTLLKPDEPFKVLWKTTSFSLDALAGCNLEAGVFFGIVTLTFWQLLIMFGATLCAIAYFGLRAGQRWAWFYLLTAFVWAAGNDSLAAVYRKARKTGIDRHCSGRISSHTIPAGCARVGSAASAPSGITIHVKDQSWPSMGNCPSATTCAACTVVTTEQRGQVYVLLLQGSKRRWTSESRSHSPVSLGNRRLIRPIAVDTLV